MKVFNGKLTIKTCTASSDGVWAITANFIDNNGVYVASDVVAGDEVYANASNANGDPDCCAFRVVSVDTALTSSTKLSCVVSFNEAYSDVSTDLFTPNIDDIAMICRMSSENGFAMVATSANGFSQNIVDTVRNISLSQRDTSFLEYVRALIAKQGASDPTKLDKAGGTVTGDLEVAGKLQADGELALTKNASKFSVTEAGVSAVFTSATPASTLTLSGTGAVNSTTSLVSSGSDVTEVSNVNAAVTASSTKTVAGKISAVSQNIVTSDSTATSTTRATGDDAVVNVTASGKTSANVTINATGATTSTVTVNADTIQLNGSVVAAGDQTVVGSVTGDKFFQTSTSTTVTDNQLTTAKYVRDYVATNAGASSVDITNKLMAKADLASVYTKTEMGALLVNIPTTSIHTTDDARFVTAAQIAAWTAKQDALGFTPENVANKNVVNGYAGLDTNAQVALVNLPRVDLSEVSLADRQANLVTGKSTKFAVTGTVNGDSLEDAKLFVYTDNALREISKIASDSKLQIPFNLITGLPATLAGIAQNDEIFQEMIAGIDGLTAGTYTSVTIGNNGIVRAASNPTTVTIDATTKKSLTIGSGFADASDVYLYADANQVKQPFIRYNQVKKVWEFSNNGIDVYEFSESMVEDDSLDFGLVTAAADSEFDAGAVADASTAVYDFNDSAVVLQ